MNVEEEELMLATVGNKSDKEELDNEVLAAVAHSIMAHYAEKEGIKKKYKPKYRQYRLEAGIKQLSKQGKSVLTKELNQFKKYKVFEQQHANNLS